MVTLPSKHSTYVPHDSGFAIMSDEQSLNKQDELAMIQDNVSSSIIGEMKMQFWRDAVKSLADVRRPLILCFHRS
jgi:hypothetical protein